MAKEKKAKPEKEKSAPREKQIKIKPHEINLVAALKQAKQNDEREKKKGRPNALVYVAGVLLLLAMGGFYAYYYMQREELLFDNEQLEMSLFMSSSQLEQAEQLSLKNKYLKELDSDTEAQLSPLEKAQSQYGYYTDALFATIKSQCKGKITINGFEVSDGIMSLTLTASAPEDAAEFVNRLRGTELFDSIEYTGFDSSDEGTTEYDVTCHIAGSPEEGGDD